MCERTRSTVWSGSVLLLVALTSFGCDRGRQVDFDELTNPRMAFTLVPSIVGPNRGKMLMVVFLSFAEEGQLLGKDCPRASGVARVEGVELPMEFSAGPGCSDEGEGECKPCHPVKWVGDTSAFYDKVDDPFEIVVSDESATFRFRVSKLVIPGLSVVPLDPLDGPMTRESSVRFRLDTPPDAPVISLHGTKARIDQPAMKPWMIQGIGQYLLSVRPWNSTTSDTDEFSIKFFVSSVDPPPGRYDVSIRLDTVPECTGDIPCSGTGTVVLGNFPVEYAGRGI